MRSSKNSAVLWRYIIVHDGGLAPHISGGICSLAVCKPGIRRHAKSGEWIMAFASTAESHGNPLVKYVMKVAENPSFETYCRTYAGHRRDAFYRYDANSHGKWFDNGYGDHNPAEMDHGRRDKSGEYALLSTEFVHFGQEPRNLMVELTPVCNALGLHADEIVDELLQRTQGQSKYCSPQAYRAFLAWVECLQIDRGEAPPNHTPFPLERHACGRNASSCR